MNTVTTVLVMFATLNPFRAMFALARSNVLGRKSSLSGNDSSPETDSRVGAALTLAVVVALVALGDPASSALGVTAPTLRLGMAIVIVLAGVTSFVSLGFSPTPGADERGQPKRRLPVWVSPVAVPVLMTIELAAASLAAGARGFKISAVVGVAVGLAVFLLLAQRSLGRASSGLILRGLHRVTAALAVVIGVAIAVTAVQTV